MALRASIVARRLAARTGARCLAISQVMVLPCGRSCLVADPLLRCARLGRALIAGGRACLVLLLCSRGLSSEAQAGLSFARHWHLARGRITL